MRRRTSLVIAAALMALSGCAATDADTSNEPGGATTAPAVTTTVGSTAPATQPATAGVVPPGFSSITTADGRVRSAEVCATASYDWLLIDGEHAPNNVQTTLQQLQAVAPYAAQPVVRAVTADVPLIKQLLDIGVQNLLVPMIDTPEQALEMVRATRYPPDGIRGVGAAVARATRWGLNSQYHDQAHD